VLWLRKFDIDISCVKLTPYNISDDELVFESNLLIPLPEAKDYIIQSERKDNAEKNLTLTQKEYLNFFNYVKTQFQTILDVNLPQVKPRNYYQIPTGKSGVHFEWAFHGRPRNSFGVELHFETSSREFNTNAISYLKPLKDKLGSKTQEIVIIKDPWGKKWSKIYIEKNSGEITDELKSWAINKMKEFYTILSPELDNYLSSNK
jgi:hypothetical protein